MKKLSCHRKCSGAVLIEFTLAISVLLLLWLGGVGLGLRIRKHVYAIDLAHIAGELLYRDCAFRPDEEISACMENARLVVRQYAEKIGLKADTSLTHIRDSTFAFNYVGPYSSPTIYYATGTSLGGSKFSAADFRGSTTPLGKVFSTNGKVWLVEVFVESRSLATIMNFGHGIAYEVSVF